MMRDAVVYSLDVGSRLKDCAEPEMLIDAQVLGTQRTVDTDFRELAIDLGLFAAAGGPTRERPAEVRATTSQNQRGADKRPR